MKNLKNTLKTVIAALGLLGILNFTTTGCKEPDKPGPKQEYSTLLFHMHTNIDTNEAEAGTAYKNADGRLISLTYAQMYLSNIKAIKSDGSVVSIKDTVILKTIDNEEFTIGSIPSGNYKTVTFDVGIDSPVNHTNPAMYHSTQALSAKPTSMWFGSTGKGYIFINIAGLLDSSVAKTGKATYPFSYQIGSDALVKTITMPDQAFTALPNTPAIVHLTIDYGKLFKGITVKTQNKTATYDDPVTAAAIATNIADMFSYEE
jgi:hypothetical protein